jgi:hypothetical protein
MSSGTSKVLSTIPNILITITLGIISYCWVEQARRIDRIEDRQRTTEIDFSAIKAEYPARIQNMANDISEIKCDMKKLLSREVAATPENGKERL